MTMGSVIEFIHQAMSTVTETWLWLVAGLVGALILTVVLLRIFFFRPFTPSAIVKSVLRITADALDKGPIKGMQVFGKEVAKLILDGVGPGDKPVTSVIASEIEDILWRRWRDARRTKHHGPAKAVWRAARHRWEACAGDILLSTEELKAALFDPKNMQHRFKEKLQEAIGSSATDMQIFSVLWSVLGEVYLSLVTRPKAQQAIQLFINQQALKLHEQNMEATERIDARTVDTHSKIVNAQATITDVARDIFDIKNEIIKPLEVVFGFKDLQDAHLRRLPTALLVVDYGVIPYDDNSNLKDELLRWVLDASQLGTSGRLYVAAGGYGKTRLALEAVTILREHYGWQTGLLPRAALETTDLRGEQDVDMRLKRFFDGRGDNGALLVLDYAECRVEQIERVTKAALSSKGSPIRIILLARSAGKWWDAMHEESREIQLVYERTPVATIANDIVDEHRIVFFSNAASKFAERLTAAQTDDDPLVKPGWESRPIPTKRLSALESVSPLVLAFEAFLYVRGADPVDSSLVEMAREERRHWARALKVKANDVARIGNIRLSLVHCSVAAITLCQGTPPKSTSATSELLDMFVEASFDHVYLPAVQESERARLYSDVRAAVESLYRITNSSGEYLQPILPDVLGEEIVGSALNIFGPKLLEHLVENKYNHLIVIWTLSRLSLHSKWTEVLCSVIDDVIWPRKEMVGPFITVARSGVGRLPLLLAGKMQNASLEQLLPFILVAAGGQSSTMGPMIDEACKQIGNIALGLSGKNIQLLDTKLGRATANPQSNLDAIVSASAIAMSGKGFSGQENYVKAKRKYIEAIEIIDKEKFLNDTLAQEALSWFNSDLAICHSQLGEHEEAIQRIEIALNLVDKCICSVSEEARLSVLRGIRDEAAYRKISILVKGDDIEASAIAIELEMNKFKLRPSLTLKEMYAYTTVLHNAGVLLFNAGDNDKAVEYFVDAIKYKELLSMHDVDRYGSNLVSSQLMLCQIYKDRDLEQAMNIISNAYEMVKQLFQKDPEGKANQMGHVLKLKLQIEVALARPQRSETANEAFIIWQIILRKFQHDYLAYDGVFVFTLCASLFLEMMEFQATDAAVVIAMEALHKVQYGESDTFLHENAMTLAKMMVIAKEGQGNSLEAAIFRKKFGLPDDFGVEIRDILKS